MKYEQAKIVDGEIKIVNSRTVNQARLSSECWGVQLQGLVACKGCDSKGKDCGGKKIRKTGKNELGFSVPI